MTYKCPYTSCNNEYSLKNKLLAHIRTHFGIKPYECKICSKSFNDKGNLKTHLRVHTGERPYKCSICPKTFKTEGQVREHLGTHYKNKPFQCPYCLKYYKRKGVVKNHMLIHYKDPSFLEKKDLYESIVNKLDGKNFVLLSDGKNNTTIFSTKEESHNNSPNLPILRQSKKLMNELLLNSDKSNTSNESYENKSKSDETYKKEKEFDESEDMEKNIFFEEKNFNNDESFIEMINKSKNENAFGNIRNIYVLGEMDYDDEKENENVEEKSVYLKELKMDNKNNNNNNIFQFEDIL